MNLTMHFQIGKWRFSVWVNMTFMTYLTWTVRWYDRGHCIYHYGHNEPYNAFPNREMEIFCLGRYDLYDLFNMDCKVLR